MIVRVTGEVRVLFGRVDHDGDVVNETPLTFPLGKICDEEWVRVFAEIQAKHQELTAAHDRYMAPPVEAEETAVGEVEETEPADALTEAEIREAEAELNGEFQAGEFQDAEF